jgi:hypothetical protein
MSNRCPDCSKMVSLEFQDPEIDGDIDGEVTPPEKDAEDQTKYTFSASCTVHLVRACADCGTEMKTADLELSVEEGEFEYDKTKHTSKECDGTFTFEQDGDCDQVEEGGGRYAKSYFGATVRVLINCGCGEGVHSFEMTDKVAASEMDEA